MIDINKLRRLAQAATPHVGHACKYQDAHWLREGHVDFENADLFIASERPQEDAAFYAAANPAAISELLDRLEEAESARRDDYQNWMTALDRNAELLAKLEAAEKENKALREALAEKVTSETMLRDLSVGNGSIHASFEGGAVQLLVDAFAGQFSESGAENYLEMHFHSPATGPLVTTVQRVNGKTPHQLREAAENELVEIRHGAAVANDTIKALRAEVIIDESANTLVKCRWKMSDMVDAFVKDTSS